MPSRPSSTAIFFFFFASFMVFLNQIDQGPGGTFSVSQSVSQLVMGNIQRTNGEYIENKHNIQAKNTS